MDPDLEKIVSGLKDKKKRSLDDRTLSVEERSRKSGLDPEMVKAYDAYNSQAKRRRTIYAGGAAVLAVGIGLFVSSHQKSPTTTPLPPQPQAPAPEIPASNSDTSPVVSTSTFDPERVLSGVRSFESALEHDRSIHVYTLSRYLNTTSAARGHYETLVNMSRQFRSQRMDMDEIFRLTGPHIDAMMTDPELMNANIYELLGGKSILERFLRSGRESHWGIYHCRENDDVCLIELPDERQSTIGALEGLCSGTASSGDLSLLSDHILGSQRFEGIGTYARTYKTSLVNLARSLIDEPGAGHTDRARILRSIIQTDLNHSVTSVNGFFTTHLDGKPYEFIGAMHNHNWGRLESEPDLDESQWYFCVVLVYNPQEGFQSRHLSMGRSLPSSRRLAVDAEHRQWYESNAQNLEPQWDVSTLSIQTRDNSYRFSSQYERGIAYAYFTDGQRFWYHHFEGEPTTIQADLRPGFFAPLVVLVGKDGRPRTLTIQ